MAAPSSPLPEDPPTGDERPTLEAFLEYYRAVVVRKAEGISEEDARRATCPPSDLTIIGIVRHLTEVERTWFRRDIAGEDAPPLYYGEAHPTSDRDGDFHPPDDATLAAALAAYADEVARSRAVLVTVASLDDVERGAHSTPRNVRWILVHMIEEYSRHAGHLDLLRQPIDGEVGD
jgi:Protein of unknown function (DUF664)